MFPTLVDYEDWLKTLPGSKTFRRGDDCECPLAKYLNMKVENAFAFVEAADGNKITFPLPPWAKAHVWEVDTTPGVIPISVKYLLSVIIPKVKERITEPFTQAGPYAPFTDEEVQALNEVTEAHREELNKVLLANMENAAREAGMLLPKKGPKS